MDAPATVIVLTAGVFNGPNHKSIGWHEVGDIVVVAGGWYAESLVEDGFVDYVDSAVSQQSVAELDALDAQIAAVEQSPMSLEPEKPKPSRKQARTQR